NVFWGCSAYPKCDFTTNQEPLGALHDTDDGPVARKDEGAICLKCGAAIELPIDGSAIVGRSLPGGPPDAAALAGKRPQPRAGRATTRGGQRTGRGARSGSGTSGRRAPGRRGTAGGGSPAA
ncbi:MAG: hypothetical protein HY264_00945, partial [Chloroflexi bacterium]|nr:hypothetical protein [Chloroflexota bacterium]